jgi:hypothetical protein
VSRQLQYEFEIEADGMVKNILHGWKHQSTLGGGGLRILEGTIFQDVIFCTTNISEEHTASVFIIRLHSVSMQK